MQSDLIQRYKEIKREHGHEDEFYKYLAIQHFQENWDIEAADFNKMLRHALKKQVNLLYNLASGTVHRVANDKPEETRELFRFLFDESIDLNERVAGFDKKMHTLITSIDSKLNGFQDERTVGVYLTFRYPEKYSLFKDSFYTKYCKLIGKKKARKGKKYSHYLELLEVFRQNHVLNDDELWDLTNAKLPNDAWKDEKQIILAQDILFYSLDVYPEPNFWVFQCNPEQYDIFNEWQGANKETWRVSAHKKDIKSGDKVILWVTGNKSGCYGLCIVTSEVLEEGEGHYVELDIDENIVNSPILKNEILDIPGFENFQGGNQGTNLKATKEQYEFFLNKINEVVTVSEDEFKLIQLIRKIGDKNAIDFHFKKIDQLTKHFKLEESDQRIVFSTPQSNKEIPVTISHRYVIKTGNEFYKVILPDNEKRKIRRLKNYVDTTNFEALRGEEKPPLWTKYSFKKEVDEELNTFWFESVSIELKRSVHSNFIRHDNPAYRKAAFNQNYQEKILRIAFSEKQLNLQTELKTSTMNNINFPQNQILYGPPGTGKTYNTINQALEICGISIPEKRNEAVKKYAELVDEGRIVFTTFHQSMSYEDFVEGIKPVLIDDESGSEKTEMIYKTEPGIFKKICEDAGEKEIVQDNSLLEISLKSKVFKVSLKSDNQAYNVKRKCFENDEIRIGWDDTGDLDEIFLNGKENQRFESLGKNDKNSIQYFYNLQGGDIVLIFRDLKTIDGIGIVEDEDYFFNTKYSEFKHVRKIKWLSKNKPIRIFELNKETNLTLPTVYRLNRISIDDITKLVQEQGIIKTEQIKKNEKPYVLIIDEINRGNVSKIFGELITLIEPDKRQGEENELEVLLPYSKTKFSVPPNLYIIGTMNTADRSIALIDTALRRRFHFKEMMPDATLLETDIDGINLQLLLDKINERIEFLLDRDHTIGHSYFMKVKSKNDVCRVFKNNVIPLLQEYFYGDWEKIQLVLGDNKSWGKLDNEKLVTIKKEYSVEEEKKLFGYDVEEYEDERIYEINSALNEERFEDVPAEAFIHIYQKAE